MEQGSFWKLNLSQNTVSQMFVSEVGMSFVAWPWIVSCATQKWVGTDFR